MLCLEPDLIAVLLCDPLADVFSLQMSYNDTIRRRMVCQIISTKGILCRYISF